VVGDEDAVSQQIRALAAVGVTDFIAAEFARGDEAEHTRRVLSRLANEVGQP
ncbi:MAG: hypothetical protein H0X18_03230, partial [Geodermatophilaceae bacterium]|nr:hypothetical protein [Geodermatophilaceae bacterium]